LNELYISSTTATTKNSIGNERKKKPSIFFGILWTNYSIFNGNQKLKTEQGEGKLIFVLFDNFILQEKEQYTPSNIF